MILKWLSGNFIEVFGAVTGIIYVFLEIKQIIWLWPVGIATSAVYIWVFFTSKFYADMSLQVYYLVISCLGWYWWAGRKKTMNGEKLKMNNDEKTEAGEKDSLQITRVDIKKGSLIFLAFLILYFMMWYILSHFTDSPVPRWDSFVTSLSIVATWMLARKIYEHWYLWIVVNSVSAILFTVKGLYPTVVLYIIYCIMSFAGLVEWKKMMKAEPAAV